MPRIVFESSDVSAKELQRVADELEMSKVKTLRLALSVMAKLSSEISRGTEVVLRQAGGKEVGLWLPHLDRSDRAGKKAGSSQKRAKRSGRVSGKSIRKSRTLKK